MTSTCPICGQTMDWHEPEGVWVCPTDGLLRPHALMSDEELASWKRQLSLIHDICDLIGRSA